MDKLLWGIDLGGTKIEGIILDPATEKVIIRKRIPTEANKGYIHILAQIENLINIIKNETGLEPQSIGIGTPGAIEPLTGLLKNSNTVVLNGKPFKADIQKILKLPVYIANDANCFALAETTMGAGKNKVPPDEIAFGVIIGTGVGGGIVLNGKIINGIHGIAGEWGHNYLDDSGGECYCGKRGCVETVISGTALEKFYENSTGEHLPLKEIYTRHLCGNHRISTDTIKRLNRYFGKAIAQVINILDPYIIIIGGGVGNIDELYTEGVAQVRYHIFNPMVETRFLKPELGDSAGVFGAALLCV